MSAVFILLAAHVSELLFWSASSFYSLLHALLIEGTLCRLIAAVRYQALQCLRLKSAPEVPGWVQQSKWGKDILFFQPATLDTASSDVVVQDGRAREELGYEPVWTTEQTIKWCCDVVQAGQQRDSAAAAPLAGKQSQSLRSKRKTAEEKEARPSGTTGALYD